jgi:hypothetical protein
LTKAPNNSPATQQEAKIYVRLCGGTGSRLGDHAKIIRGIACQVSGSRHPSRNEALTRRAFIKG